MVCVDAGGPARRLRLVERTGRVRELPAATGPADETSKLTLRDVWERYVRPEAELMRSPRTLEADLETLRKLDQPVELHGPGINPRITNPGVLPVREISEPVILAWTNQLLQHLSAGTVNRHLRVLRKLLRAAQRAGLLQQVPRVRLVPQPRKRPLVVTLEEVARLYEAADAAKWPKIGPRSPADFWRTILVGCWTYGFRTQDLVGYRTSRDEGLLWSEVIFSPRAPAADVTIENPAGWLDVLPNKTSRTRGETLLLPLSRAFRRHLELWAGIDERRVLPNGRSKRQFAEEWNRIREAAGLPPEVTLSAPAGGQRRLRSVRKGCSNNWDRASGRKLGRWVLGQMPVGTNDTYYTDTLPDIVYWIDRIPIPDCFLR